MDIDLDAARRTLRILLLLSTRSGHLAQRVAEEHRGNCLPPGRCTSECRLWRQTFLEWCAIVERLEADAAPPDRQPSLFEGVAG